MSSEPTGVIVGRYTVWLRVFFAGFGCFAIWWGGFVFPEFWKSSAIERLAARIPAGESFRSDVLIQQRPILENIEGAKLCQPDALRSAAIVRLRLVDLALSSAERDRANENFESLRQVVRNSLTCSPADPYLWLALYWINKGENREQSPGLAYLRMSYLTGPNEGWVGLKRNRFAFERFNQLPGDLAESAIREFVGLVQSGFFRPAAETFMSLNARERDLVMGRLNPISKRYRDEFLRMLRDLGYDAG